MKEDLRKIFRNKRRSLSATEISARSKEINENFLQNLLPKIYQKNSGEIFSLYLATSEEVSTDLIAKHLRQNQIPTAYPKIVAKNQPLEFVLADQHTTFVANKLIPQVKEPQVGKIVLPDFLIIPLLAFDSNLSRLGMGGGFFDRTIELLKNTKSKIVTIGLAFDFQLSKQPLPIEATDRGLDFIVTEKNLFSSTHTSSGSTTK